MRIDENPFKAIGELPKFKERLKENIFGPFLFSAMHQGMKEFWVWFLVGSSLIAIGLMLLLHFKYQALLDELEKDWNEQKRSFDAEKYKRELKRSVEIYETSDHLQ